eukprot:18028_1
MSTTIQLSDNTAIEILKQGWLQKKTKYIGSWKMRWVVLKGQYLFLFKNKNINTKATETIRLSTTNCVVSLLDTMFSIQGDNKYEFKSNSTVNKTQWVNAINKCKDHNCIKLRVIVQCHRDKAFNDQFELIIPYDNKYLYGIKVLIADIMQYIHQKHIPFKFIATKIKSNSFIGHELNYNDYEWSNSKANIIDYDIKIIKQKGMHLEIDIDIYQHEIISNDNMCPKMSDDNGLCPIYAQMRYQDIFNEKCLNHLYEYQHPDTTCKFGDECDAFKRLTEGGNQLKDRCHALIYKHPPRDTDRAARARQKGLPDGINSFCLNDEWAENKPLYHPTNEDEKGSNYNDINGYLKPLIKEIVDNGYKSDLCLNDDDEKNNLYSIMSVVNAKLKCMRHRLMGSPLNRAEMLSLLLYTDGDSNYELCKSQRNGDYKTWKWFDYCLYNAIHKLSKREHGSYKIFT